MQSRFTHIFVAAVCPAGIIMLRKASAQKHLFSGKSDGYLATSQVQVLANVDGKRILGSGARG